MQTNCFSSLRSRALCALFSLFFLAPLAAQKNVTLDKNPEYPGGMSAMIDYLSKNIHYPEAAKKENAEGMVIVKFTVGADGSLSGIKTVSEKSQNPRADFVKEAVRVIKSMPRWAPGEAQGKKVKSEMTLPIKFRLS